MFVLLARQASATKKLTKGHSHQCPTDNSSNRSRLFEFWGFTPLRITSFKPERHKLMTFVVELASISAVTFEVKERDGGVSRIIFAFE